MPDFFARKFPLVVPEGLSVARILILSATNSTAINMEGFRAQAVQTLRRRNGVPNPDENIKTNSGMKFKPKDSQKAAHETRGSESSQNSGSSFVQPALRRTNS